MSTYEARLAALREQLKAERLDGFVVPLTDEHMSEYVGSYAQRLAWLTGFQGSAGSAVVLPEEAAIFVDGRYTLQVRDQVDGNHWSYQSVPETSIADWLKLHAPDDGRIGYDPWLHTKDWVTKAREALAERGAELVAVRRNPIDAVWADQPEPSRARLIVHPDDYAGQSSAAKRQAMADWLKEQKADAAVLAALDSIAWTFNVRGKDVEHTPVALSFALVREDGTADLFVASEKIGDDVRQHLGNGVRIHERDAFEGLEHSRMWHRAFERMESGRVPVVAVLKGAVIGGGQELASATHLRVAEPSAFYALPEGQHGLFVGGGGSVRVPRLIGAHRMADMMLTGRVVDAQEGFAKSCHGAWGRGLRGARRRSG